LEQIRGEGDASLGKKERKRKRKRTNDEGMTSKGVVRGGGWWEGLE
jgi:hypothetical protein